MFSQYLREMADIAWRHGEVLIPVTTLNEDLVKIQKIQADISNDYTDGKLSDLEKRTLNSVSFIIMRNIREALEDSKKGVVE